MDCHFRMWTCIVTLWVMNLCVVLSCSPQYGYRLNAFENKKISQSEMWTLNSKTKAECISECFNETYCMSVHYVPSEGVCIALRERFQGTVPPATDVPGYTLYQTGKPLSEPGVECELDVDCLSLANAHCNEGQCRCDVGYEPSGPVCRTTLECTAFTDTFTRYIYAVIIGFDYKGARGAYNRPACELWCAETPDCKSADFDFIGNICYLNDKSWFEVAPAQRTDTSPIFDFFQRGCLTWSSK